MTDPIGRTIRAIALLAVASILVACGSRPARAPIDLTVYSGLRDYEKVINTAERQLAEGSEYYLGPGDILFIALLGRPDILDESLQRDPDSGFIVTESPYLTLPLIGAIKVHGRTVSQLQADLKAAYTKYIRDPEPIVYVKKFNYNQVSVVGSVQKPGRYPLDFGDTLLDGLFKAGGLSMGGRSGGLAPARYLKLYREKLTRREKAELTLEEIIKRVQTDSQIVPREEIVIPIQEFVFYGRLSYNIPLLPNDIIYVPPAGTASVVGKVKEPGAVFLGPSVGTLSQVLTERGGLRLGADADVEVVRLGDDGVPIVYEMNARRILKRKDPDFLIQDGDQVFVHGNVGRGILEWFGTIFRTSVSGGASATYNPVAG